MDETMDGFCLSCGKRQQKVLCLICRPHYHFMRDWGFERIMEYFLGVQA